MRPRARGRSLGSEEPTRTVLDPSTRRGIRSELDRLNRPDDPSPVRLMNTVVQRTRRICGLFSALVGPSSCRERCYVNAGCPARCVCTGWRGRTCGNLWAVTSCRGFVSLRRARLGSFCRGVTDCRGFVLSRRYKLPWLRFARGRGNGLVSSRRYILPWVRFAAVHKIGFVLSRRYILPWVHFAAVHKIGFVLTGRYKLSWLPLKIRLSNANFPPLAKEGWTLRVLSPWTTRHS
jgi:hypothetical protein